VDSNKSTVATRQEKRQQTFTTKANKAAVRLKQTNFIIQQAQLKHKRIAFKGLITTTKSAPKTDKNRSHRREILVEIKK